jgi:hypothetical protein
MEIDSETESTSVKESLTVPGSDRDKDSDRSDVRVKSPSDPVVDRDRESVSMGGRDLVAVPSSESDSESVGGTWMVRDCVGGKVTDAVTGFVYHV